MSDRHRPGGGVPSVERTNVEADLANCRTAGGSKTVEQPQRARHATPAARWNWVESVSLETSPVDEQVSITRGAPQHREGRSRASGSNDDGSKGVA